MKKNNIYSSRKISKVSRNKSNSDRKLLNNFRKENKENLYNGDVTEMYSDSIKYNFKSINGDLKTRGKYLN